MFADPGWSLRCCGIAVCNFDQPETTWFCYHCIYIGAFHGCLRVPHRLFCESFSCICLPWIRSCNKSNRKRITVSIVLIVMGIAWRKLCSHLAWELTFISRVQQAVLEMVLIRFSKNCDLFCLLTSKQTPAY